MAPEPFLTCPTCQENFPLESGIFGCPGHRPGEEHILRRDPGAGPRLAEELRLGWAAGRPGSFDLFGPLTSAFALSGGDRYGRILQGLTERLLHAEGRSFDVTPLTPQPGLASALDRGGRLWVKDETGNVAGSHKGRHLMGTLLYLEALRALRGGETKRTLAVYSCGNAALAAAAVARAGGYALHAFVPQDVPHALAGMLAERGAVVERIPRAGTGAGDPCYLAFREALRRKGWLPFACAGNDNWSNIEGGATLGWEVVMALDERAERLDAAVIQVGGGALARAVAQAFEEALRLGFLAALPRIYAGQPEGGFPFVRAYLLTLSEIARRVGEPFGLRYDRSAEPAAELAKLADFARERGAEVRRVAAVAAARFDSPPVQAALAAAARERGRFMWPWDGPAPQSLAHGILDDFTYDWYFLLRAVLRSGGGAEILAEETLREAHALARRHTGIPACATGTAGLAGLIQLKARGEVAPGESVGLFFTGLDRAFGAAAPKPY